MINLFSEIWLCCNSEFLYRTMYTAIVSLRQSAISLGAYVRLSSRGTPFDTRGCRDSDRLAPESWNRARGHRGIKDNCHNRHNQFAALNYLNVAARQHEGSSWWSFSFLFREWTIPREILPRDSATVFLHGHEVIRRSSFSLSLSSSPSRPDSLLLSGLPLSIFPAIHKLAPGRRGSISTMIVIHVRYNRKLAAAT